MLMLLRVPFLRGDAPLAHALEPAVMAKAKRMHIYQEQSHPWLLNVATSNQ
jgi:hypothetical protein